MRTLTLQRMHSIKRSYFKWENLFNSTRKLEDPFKTKLILQETNWKLKKWWDVNHSRIILSNEMVAMWSPNSMDALIAVPLDTVFYESFLGDPPSIFSKLKFTWAKRLYWSGGLKWDINYAMANRSCSTIRLRMVMKRMHFFLMWATEWVTRYFVHWLFVLLFRNHCAFLYSALGHQCFAQWWVVRDRDCDS